MTHRLDPQTSCSSAPRSAARLSPRPGSSPPAAAAAVATAAATTAGGRRRSSSPTTLRFSNWPLYIDIDEKTKKRPTLDAVHEEDGVKVDYIEDINANDEFFGKIQGPLSRGQSIDRDIIVLTDNSRYPSLMIDKGWVEKLDKSAIPNIANLVDVARRPGLRPEPRVQPAVAVGHDRDRLQREADRRRSRSIDQLLEDPKLKGKVTMLTEMADTLGARHARERRRPERGRPTRRSTSAIDRVKTAVDSGQIRQFTGNDYTGPLARATSSRRIAWSGDIVQLQADNPNLEVGHARRRRHDLDRQHADPEGRRRLHGLDVHELRLRPGDRGADRGLRQLRHAGEGREGGAREDRPGARREPADLPDADDARRSVHELRPEGARRTTSYQRAVAGA